MADDLHGSPAAWETVDKIRKEAEDMAIRFSARSDFAEHLAECLDLHYNMGRAYERALKTLDAAKDQAAERDALRAENERLRIAIAEALPWLEVAAPTLNTSAPWEHLRNAALRDAPLESTPRGGVILPDFMRQDEQTADLAAQVALLRADMATVADLMTKVRDRLRAIAERQEAK